MVAKTIENSVTLENSEAKILILNKADSLDKLVKKVSPSIVISTSKIGKKMKGVSIIDSSGEYEVQDVLMFVFSSKDDDENDVIALDLGGVKIVYLGSRVKSINKRVRDLLGIDHVLFLDLKSREDVKISDLINDFEPEFLVPLAIDKSKVASLANELNLKLDDEINKLRIAANSLNNDDPVMSIVNLK